MGEELQGLFCGHKCFTSSKNNNRYFVLSFLLLNKDELRDRTDYYIADIFVDEKSYGDFLDGHELLNFVSLKRDIVGNKVRYYI